MKKKKIKKSKKINRRGCKCKGFTLIELLVVIAIIGLLSTLAVISLSAARERARDAKRLTDVKNIQTALEIYYTSKGEYPTGTDLNLETEYLCDVTGWQAAACDPATKGSQLIKVPADPGPAAYVYTYTATGTPPTTYKIQFELEAASGSLVKGDNCATPNGLAVTCQ